MDHPDLKECSKCGDIKELHKSNFRPRKGSNDGFRGVCLVCQKLHLKGYRMLSHVVESRKIENKKYNSRPDVKEKKKKYKKKKGSSSEWVRCKYLNDKEFKLKRLLRGRLRELIKGSMSKTDLIGSSKETIKHLESLFYDRHDGVRMNWSNHGSGKNKWQIDHIIEFRDIDLNNKNDLKKVCHYTNLQPLWYKDHQDKTYRRTK